MASLLVIKHVLLSAFLYNCFFCFNCCYYRNLSSLLCNTLLSAETFSLKVNFYHHNITFSLAQCMPYFLPPGEYLSSPSKLIIYICVWLWLFLLLLLIRRILSPEQEPAFVYSWVIVYVLHGTDSLAQMPHIKYLLMHKWVRDKKSLSSKQSKNHEISNGILVSFLFLSVS